MRSIQQLANAHRRHRPAEQIALRLGHRAVGADQFQLLVGLDAFDHNRHSKIGTEPRHAAQQRQRTIAIDSFQEGTIDLHFLQREVMQIAQARITGAEVIQRYPHTDHVQLRQHIVGQLCVAQQRRFGDLDLEAVCGQSGDLERVTNLAQHVALMELLRRKIDRNADAFRPFHAFHAGLAQDPAAEVYDETHVLGDRNDVDRRNRAPRRMIPSQQRFARRYSPGLEIDERLIEQLEFLMGKRLAQIQFQNAASLDGLRHLVAEEAERSATVRLGAIERHVGVLQQRIGADTRGRRHCNANAGADLDQMIVDLVALAEAIDDAPGETRGILVGCDVLLEHHEFVATEPRHEILRAQHFAQPAGDGA